MLHKTIDSIAEKLVEQLDDGLIFINLKEQITYMNPAAEKILMRSQESLIHKNLSTLFTDVPLINTLKKSLIEKTSIKNLSTSIECSVGNQHELSVQGTYVESEGLILTIRDITEQLRAEHTHQRLNRLSELGEIASIVAHEIRNPLGGIKGFASLLERDLSGTPDAQKLATYILQGTDSLNNIVTRVLEYSRPIQVEVTPKDLLDLIKKVKNEILRNETYNNQAKITIHSSEDPFIVPHSPNEFRTAILNLIENACQAMSNEGGQIEITLEKTKNQALINISDNGYGIAESNLKKIFSPFFTTKTDGDGFGLSEVHKIIEAHNGSIEIKSVEGQGTNVTIALPLKKLEVS